ncbi:hypothetical protein Tco_0815256 [Tanacetum coccineum]
MGKGLSIPTDTYLTPTFIQPSTQPQKTQKPRKPKRKDTQVPQPSDPIESVADEAVHKELGDSLVRATTTASSLEAEQGSGNINKTQSKETPNKSSSQGTTSGGGPRGNTVQSDEVRLKLDELIALCTTLQNWVLDLEKTKTTHDNEISSLKRRVKKLEKKNSLGEDASKLGRIDAIDADEEITLVSVQNLDEKMFDVNVLDGEEVFVAEQEVAANEKGDEVNVVEVVEVINAAQVSAAGNVVSTATASTTTATTTTADDITFSQDKGKGLLIEPVKPMKKKDQTRLDEETALNLQAAFDEEERLTREKAEKEEKANIALIETWDDIQAKIDADHQLAERMQA